MAGSVAEMLDALPFPESDPRTVLGACLVRLGDAFDRAPSAALAREIRALTGQIMDDPRSAPGALDEIRARRAARRIDGLVAAGAEMDA